MIAPTSVFACCNRRRCRKRCIKSPWRCQWWRLPCQLWASSVVTRSPRTVLPALGGERVQEHPSHVDGVRHGQIAVNAANRSFTVSKFENSRCTGTLHYISCTALLPTTPTHRIAIPYCMYGRTFRRLLPLPRPSFCRSLRPLMLTSVLTSSGMCLPRSLEWQGTPETAPELAVAGGVDRDRCPRRGRVGGQ